MDATSWNERYTGSDLVWPTSANRWVVSELEGHFPGDALDLGCGEGRNAMWLAEQGWRVTAVDFAENALARAREQAASTLSAEDAERITWTQGDVLTFEMPSSAYDLVLSTYVHLEDYERREMLRNCVRALRPGGTVLVVGHDSTNLADGIGGPQQASILFTGADIEKDLQDHLGSGALHLERSGRAAREVATEEGIVVAWDALFRARRRAESTSGFAFGS